MDKSHANHCIECAVNECDNHCDCDNYCALDKIQVGTHECNPSEVACTDCQSFKAK